MCHYGTTETLELLCCPACSHTTLDARRLELACLACGRTFPFIDGILDMSNHRHSGSVDKPYEGHWGRFYGWFMDHPSWQRLDAWLLGLNVRHYYHAMISRLDALSPGPSLEIPSGNAPFFGRTATYRRGGPWIFIDLSWTLLRQLANKLDTAGSTGHLLIRTDARFLPVRSQCIKNIVSPFGFHCFHDKAAVFAELHRCLRTDGHIVVSTLTTDGPPLSRLYHRLHQLDGTFAPNNSAANLISLARRHGFAVTNEARLGSTYLFDARRK